MEKKPCCIVNVGVLFFLHIKVIIPSSGKADEQNETYALGKSIEVKKFFNNRINWKSKKIEDVIEAVPNDVIVKEMDSLNEKHHLFDSGDFSVFCVPSMEIPNVLTEIGRLREITFREVGEGTNKSVDLDEYDLYYSQLIVLD